MISMVSIIKRMIAFFIILKNFILQAKACTTNAFRFVVHTLVCCFDQNRIAKTELSNTLIIISTATLLVSALTANAETPIIRQLRMGYTLRNKSSEVIKESEFIVRMPLAETPWQRCADITATDSYETVKEVNGGQLLRFNLTNLMPYASKVIWVDVNIEMKPQSFDALNTSELLEAKGLFEASDIAFQKELRRLKRRSKNTADLSEMITERVHDIVRINAYSSKNRGATYALKTGKGDCSEQMALATALCRLSSIPAIGVSGVHTTRNRVMHASDYHDWSAVYTNGKWNISDPLYEYYGSEGINYIAFEWIYGTETPDGYVRRYRVSNSNIKVRME